jgi:hypothetical protein
MERVNEYFWFARLSKKLFRDSKRRYSSFCASGQYGCGRFDCGAVVSQ